MLITAGTPEVFMHDSSAASSVHPHWCDPAQCDVASDTVHFSIRHIATNGCEAVGVQLSQGKHPETLTMDLIAYPSGHMAAAAAVIELNLAAARQHLRHVQHAVALLEAAETRS
jgi:hypothetical protein